MLVRHKSLKSSFLKAGYRYLLLSLLLLTGTEILHAQYRHIIRFDNLSKKKGVLYIGWYKSAEDFRQPDKAVISRQVAVEGKESEWVHFADIKPGTYAVAVFFDRDGDGKLDTNFLGIPKERYGFSNNVYPAMRAANFKEAAFEVKENGEQVIRLK